MMVWPWQLRKGKKPLLLQWRSSEAFIVTMASFAVFTDIFLYAVIVPVIPFSLSGRAGVAENKIQYWVSILLAVYGAALLIASPFWGFLADRVRNRRIPMLVGLVVIAGATLFLCLSVNLAMLVVGRVLQGISGALTWTVGLALVIDTVDVSRVGRATGWIGMSTSVGMLVSPLLGGVVYGRAGYYAVFAMCFGLIGWDIVLRVAVVEVGEAKRWVDAEGGDGDGELAQRVEDSVVRGHDEQVKGHGDNAGDAEKGCLPQPAPEQQQQQQQQQQQDHKPPSSPAAPTSSPPSNSSLASTLHLLRNPRLLAALWGTLVLAIFQTSFDSTLPLLVHSVFGWDSIGAGLVYLPIVLPSFLSPLIGMLSDRVGAKWPVAGGYLAATPFLICLRFVKEDSLGHKVMLCGLLLGVGCCISFVLGPLMAEITWAVMPDDADDADAGADGQGGEERHDPAAVPYALAYGLWNMAFSAGAMLGPVMGGMIRDSAGWGTVGWTLGLVSFVTGITQAIWIGKPLKLSKLRLLGKGGEVGGTGTDETVT